MIPIILGTLFGSGILLLAKNIWGLLLIAGSFFGLAITLKKISAIPPTLGLVTIWGKRTKRVKREGWRFFAPFFPFLYDFIPINVEKKNIDFTPEDVRTKEKAELSINSSLTYTPAQNYLIEFINAGGENGVKNILSDMVGEKIREYSIEKSWEEVLETRTEMVRFLIGEIAGLEDLPDIENVRRGNGTAIIESLGIVLNRFNVTNITIKGELAKAAELAAKEEREREAERVEQEHIRARIQELINMGFAPNKAADIVQTERKKVEKKIFDIQGLENFGRGWK